MTTAFEILLAISTYLLKYIRAKGVDQVLDMYLILLVNRAAR